MSGKQPEARPVSSSSTTEREALLARHAKPTARRTRREAKVRSSSRPKAADTKSDDDDDDDGDNYGATDDRSRSACVPNSDGADSEHSGVSHVLLDASPTYTRLVWSHVMSLLPCIAFLLASVMLAWHAPCHIHQAPADRTHERRMCVRMLSDRVSLAAFGLGVICWLAAYAVRPAIWKLIELVGALIRISELGSGQFASGAATVAFVLGKTIALEVLRLFSVLMGNALIFAGLLRISSLDKDIIHPPAPDRWVLHWFDPRFTVAVWVAIGWAVTEFFVTSWQTFDRLALYEVDYDRDDSPIDGDVEDEAAEADAGFPTLGEGDTEAPRYHLSQQLSDSDTGADNSDSAATVRGRSSGIVPQYNGNGTAAAVAAADGKHASKTSAYLSPNARLLDARRRVLVAAEESGFSIAQSQDDEAEELGALREKLDMEMDSLVKARTRVELEAAFGQPLPTVPIVLCTLWRVDGWLWNLGSTLLMSASVTLAQGPLTGHQGSIPSLFPPVSATSTTLVSLILLHTIFTTTWSVGIPTFGFALVTYASMLAGVGLCVTASARWGLLI